MTRALNWYWLIVVIAITLGLCLAIPSQVDGQSHLPFFPGEVLNYRIRVSPFGTVGMGSMTVEGPLEVRGTPVLLLRSEMRSTVALVRGIDQSSSWIDPQAMRTLRFEKHERSPFTKVDEAVDIFGPEGTWRADDGLSGSTATAFPLDELSFIYFLRTLPLVPGTTFSFDRHYDPGRNPVVVRVLGEEAIEVGAGSFAATVVEMKVRDRKRYRGEGVIRIYLSQGACRLPLRIETAVPRLGTTVMLLESHSHPIEHFTSPGT